MEFKKYKIQDRNHVRWQCYIHWATVMALALSASRLLIIFFMVTGFCVSADEQVEDLEQPENIKLESSRSISEYQLAIHNLRIKYNPYDTRVGELLLGLGLSYQIVGNHKEAIDVLSDAFLISRVNTGLFTLKDIDMLELILKSHIALGNMEKIDEVYAHMYWIYQRNYEDNDPRWLPILRRLYFWHTENAYLTTSRAYYEHRDIAFEVYDHADQIIFELTGKKNIADCFWNAQCCVTLDECAIVSLDTTLHPELSYLGSRVRKMIAWHAKYGWD